MNCSFCGDDIERGTGVVHVQSNGATLNFCSSKCRKNVLNLGRKTRDTEWAK